MDIFWVAFWATFSVSTSIQLKHFLLPSMKDFMFDNVPGHWRTNCGKQPRGEALAT